MDSDILKLCNTRIVSKKRNCKDANTFALLRTSSSPLQIADKFVQLSQEREVIQPGFQPSFVGVIYEEMSILDTFDEGNTGDVPLLFEEGTVGESSEPLSGAALGLRPKVRSATSRLDVCERTGKPSSQNISRKKQRIAKEGSNIFLNSMKLSGLLGNAVPTKNLMRIESLTRSSKSKGRMGGKLTRLLFERRSCQNSAVKCPLPSIKASPQPERNMLKTSYLHLYNFNLKQAAHKVRSASDSVAKQRRPKSGEKASSMIKKHVQQATIKHIINKVTIK
eukprot:TRINITY_DN4936_c0_g1_i1.p1 TRINITY_DN4936_c0_g1~~TRINITY_DN4936_c0_g1_i1.p1  ORF type:complete len:302 (-),score=48.97 TRINITY_DN4936_c0_g1_i1:113-949(-)